MAAERGKKKILSLKKGRGTKRSCQKETEREEEGAVLPYCGLSNLGYTCYANAVIQALEHTPGLMELIIKYKGGSGDESIYYCLRELLLQMNVPERGMGTVVIPVSLIEKLQGSYFENGIQHDSQECLSILLDSLTTKNRKRTLSNDDHNPLPPPVKILKGNQKISCFFSPKLTTPESPPPAPPISLQLPGSIFQGVLVQETKCYTCEEIQTREESFNMLSIPVLSKGDSSYCGAYSLSWSLSQFSSVEYLRECNKYYCKSCLQLTEATHRTVIHELPKIMAIHLKHFSGQQVKAAGNIAIPLYTSFNMITSSSNKSNMYELYCIILHTGSSSYSGHYTSIIKKANNNNNNSN
uniref:USP domain-containing protein n=1 Tax=Amphimedon queenslandica TaxID=400682 RepID=A0A1X7VV70_AMPQE